MRKMRFWSLMLCLLLPLGLWAGDVTRVLAIGNSFSQDAVEQYLHELGEADGVHLVVGNLYIGGCSLERHVKNIRDDKADYAYRKVGLDGKKTEQRNFTVARALADEPWDYVSVQQVSGLSGVYDSYNPYIAELLNYVRKHVGKKTKILLHQPWAYAKNSDHGAFSTYDRDQEKMHRAIVETSARVAKENKVNMIIPSGTAIQIARSTFMGDHMTRDGYHLDLKHGRYTAACTWYETLTGRSVVGNAFAPEGMHELVKNACQQSAHGAVALSPNSSRGKGVMSLPNRELSASHTVTSEVKLITPSPSGEGRGEGLQGEKLWLLDLPLEMRIDNLLSFMTLEEKVLQLNQYTLGWNNNPNNVGAVNEIPAEIGSLIFFDTDPAIRNKMQRKAVEESRLGIPIVFGYDAIHGFRTIYPISLAQACSWNPQLVEKTCAMSAREARASGVDWTFSPMIDVARDPRWGRVAEGYGEDPYTNGVFGAASVRGYQGKDMSAQDRVAACLKHYVGYGASEAGRDYVYTEISPQTLWDTYLSPYREGVKAGAATVMSAFNDISGVPASANHYTMTEILKNRWRFDGFVVSDWAAVEQLISQGHAADKRDATEKAFNAGVEMDMMSKAYDHHLADLVKEGKVSMELLDESVRRVLRLKFRLGLFEHPYTPETREQERFLLPEHIQLAKQLATESMVLLKNEQGVLPLSGQKRIAVIGPMATDRKDLLGNWLGHGKAEDVETIAEAVSRRFSGAKVAVADGCPIDGELDETLLAEAVKVAREADVVLLCLGEKLEWSGENAARSTIALPSVQEKLAQAVRATGKPVVLLLVNGRPLDLSRLEPLSDAILELWQPGMKGAEAAADLLAGVANPSAKLCITFPRSTGQIPIYYNRRYPARRNQGFYCDMSSEPLYSFAHGLSYTTFAYGEPKASATEVKKNGKLTIEVNVTNTGSREGAETVQWFVSDPVSSITRPMKELKHFEKQVLQPGETRVFRFDIVPQRDFAYVDSDGRKLLESGEYIVSVGGKQVKIQCQ